MPINFSTKIIKGVAITRVPFTSASILPMLAVGSYYAGIGDGLFNVMSLVLGVLGASGMSFSLLNSNLKIHNSSIIKLNY